MTLLTWICVWGYVIITMEIFCVKFEKNETYERKNNSDVKEPGTCRYLDMVTKKSLGCLLDLHAKPDCIRRFTCDHDCDKGAD